MVIHDQHVHSYYSVDSKESLENYVQLAVKLGQEYFITTEHLDINLVNKGFDWTFDRDARRKEFETLKTKYPSITFLEGIEVGYKKKYFDQLLKWVNGYNYDLINLSVHDFDGINFYHSQDLEQYGIDWTINLYYKTLLEAVNSGIDFDVLCHIDYVFKSLYLTHNEAKLSKYEEVVSEVFKALIAKDKTLEINTKVQEMINDEHTAYILNLYRKLGGTNLTLSSDAHTVNRYRSSFDHYIELIKKCGFDHICYFVKRERFNYPI